MMRKITPVYIVTLLVVLWNCGPKIRIQTLENIPLVNPYGEDITKAEALTEKQHRRWMLLDLAKDTIPGASIDKLYREVLTQIQPVTKTVVAVIDSGIDIHHEDLGDIIWTNENEIPNNGIDDDHNGYVDDVHGWNFLGDSNKETLEMVRVIRSGNKDSETYRRAKGVYEKKLREVQTSAANVELIYKWVQRADSLMLTKTGKYDYTIEQLSAVIDDLGDERYDKLRRFALFGDDMNVIRDEITEDKKYYDSQLQGLAMDFDGRAVLGDDPDDFNVEVYGNADVPGPDIEDNPHGTHCSGIIAAIRDNDKGIDGIADNVQIMPIRTIPDGDEYDKDVVMAIRYAVDNGAKVISCSFGKGFSPYVNKVQEALKYAASKDVLIVIAAGNDGKNVDVKKSFPTDVSEGVEITDNVITVGAITSSYGEDLVAPFSNYGYENVDIFAPGHDIYSTVPNDNYKSFSGTSMATPVVSGVAGIIRSYYPQLTASQVKKIILSSGLTYPGKVKVGNRGVLMDFSSLSKTGMILNGYNAFLLANKVASGKVSI